MPLVILLNGPPRSGKDTAAEHLLGLLPQAVRLGMADALKAATHRLYGQDPAPRAFEAVKDQPCPEFHGRTPRECYIALSEALMKPLHGPEVFGRLWVAEAERQVAAGARLLLVPDSGFAAEAMPILAWAGPDNLLLLQVRAAARGCSFARDSRSYITLPGVPAVPLANELEGNPAPFLAALRTRVRGWLAERGEREMVRQLMDGACPAV